MMHDGDIDKANSYLHRMADPEDEEYLYYLYDVAQIFVDHNLHHEALEWVNEALKVDSDDVESKVLKGEILVNLENMDAAIEFLSHTLDEMPYSVECWNLLSQAHYIAEHYNDAIDACDFVLAIDEKNTEALLMKANCFYHLENSEEAHKLYERYSTLNPDDEMAYFFNGVTLFDMGRYKESLEQLLTAEKVSQGYSPDMGQIYVQLAFTYSKLENTEAAVEYINKALDLEPDDAELFAIRGHLEVAGGERKKGADDYCQALQMTHNDENMLFKIAMSLYDNELFNSSLRLFRNLVEVDEEKWRHLYPFIALCHLYLNHGHKYLEYLKMACETDSANAKEVLGPLFPDMNPSDYYAYALKMWKSKKPQRPKKQ
jgi:tetratricopeptide (TPR) repeat protein